MIKELVCYNLDLSNNRITHKGLKELTDSITEDSRTNYIAIHNNDIGDEGIQSINDHLNLFIKGNMYEEIERQSRLLDLSCILYIQI